jgi:hypothetical protein
MSEWKPFPRPSAESHRAMQAEHRPTSPDAKITEALRIWRKNAKRSNGSVENRQ